MIYAIALIIAIMGEVVASTMLKLSEGFTKIWPVIILLIGYGVAFVGLSLSLDGIPLGVAYAIWSGIGTAATVVVGVILFKEGIDSKKIMGIVLVILGVILLNLA